MGYPDITSSVIIHRFTEKQPQYANEILTFFHEIA